MLGESVYCGVLLMLIKLEVSCSNLRSFSLEGEQGFVFGSEAGKRDLADLFEDGHLSGDPICDGFFGKGSVAV